MKHCISFAASEDDKGCLCKLRYCILPFTNRYFCGFRAILFLKAAESDNAPGWLWIAQRFRRRFPGSMKVLERFHRKSSRSGSGAGSGNVSKKSGEFTGGYGYGGVCFQLNALAVGDLFTSPEIISSHLFDSVVADRVAARCSFQTWLSALG